MVRLQSERDADHSALRTAVELSGHLVLGKGGGKTKDHGGEQFKGKGKGGKK